MKPEYDKLLCEQFPKLYAERNMSAEESCMAWGLAVGDGWFPIIKALSISIQRHIDQRAKEIVETKKWNEMVARGEQPAWWHEPKPPSKRKVPKKVRQVVVKQVKEKFGTLRFYIEGGDDEIRAMVSLAETMSGVVCEDCGAPGTTGGHGWVRTLCPTCRDNQPKREYDE